MCSGREPLIIDIVGTENEHLRKMGIAYMRVVRIAPAVSIQGKI
jgi:hypothetical protein